MTDRYATNAFVNFSQFENGVFSGKGVSKAGPNDILKGDNPAFIWPANTRKVASGSLADKEIGPVNQPVQRGYMRMLAQGFKEKTALERRRLHFQFNPELITRAVSARNDIQNWMNMDPVQLTQPIPGDANFSFELFFNREAEVASGAYRNGYNGPIVGATGKANLPVSASDKTSTFINASAVTDIGVLADLIVFDEIIGQGINTQLIQSVLNNAQKTVTQQRNAAASRQTNEPSSPATGSVTVTDGKITNVVLSYSGSGYVTEPTISVIGKGTGAKLKATFSNGRITGVTIVNQGSNYDSTTSIIFSGGGGGSSGNATSDSQDQIPAEFNEGEARAALTTNFGNSAFLVSLPVRIVFSSLFIVEGYITSTQVTFNKFNTSMVPTQCVVGITMQAMYIGFAKEKTYFTSTLTEALNTAVTDNTTGLSNLEKIDVQGLSGLGEDLFRKVDTSDDGPNFYTNYDSNLSPSKYLKDGYDYNFSLRWYASTVLQNELKKGTISGMSQTATLTFKYVGNSSATEGTFPVGESLTLSNTEDMSIKALKDASGFKDAAQSITHKFSFGDNVPLVTGQSFDQSDTSKWEVTLTIVFNLTSSFGATSEAKQKFIAKTPKPVKFTQEVSGKSLGYFIPKGSSGK